MALAMAQRGPRARGSLATPGGLGSAKEMRVPRRTSLHKLDGSGSKHNWLLFDPALHMEGWGFGGGWWLCGWSCGGRGGGVEFRVEKVGWEFRL